MRGRLNLEGADINLGGLTPVMHRLKTAQRIIIVACGTSWHAALLGEYLIEQLGRLPVEVEYGSEFRYARRALPAPACVRLPACARLHAHPCARLPAGTASRSSSTTT